MTINQQKSQNSMLNVAWAGYKKEMKGEKAKPPAEAEPVTTAKQPRAKGGKTTRKAK